MHEYQFVIFMFFSFAIRLRFSVVFRPSHYPVRSWSLAVYKSRGGRPGPSKWRQFLPRYTREGGVLDWKNAFHASSSFWTRSGAFFASWTLETPALGQKLHDKASSSFFRLRTPPPSVYLGRHWCHLVDQAFPPNLHTASDHKLDSGKPWVRGWLHSPWKSVFILLPY